MYSEKIKYTDFNGVEREEEFWFHIGEHELIKLEFGTEGGVEALVKKIVAAKDNNEIIQLFEKLIQLSYGEKSADGKHFRKSPEILDDFMSTEAYNILFMELATDADKAAKFLIGCLPKNLQAEVAKNPQFMAAEATALKAVE